MKKILFFIVIFGITIGAIAQQIPLKGVVTVQNSKTYTGNTQYVKNAEITHPNAKSDVTDDDGKFTLNITGLQKNIQTQIEVTLHGTYRDYVVVNEKELQSITLGRVTPVGIYICKKGELEQRQAEMVGINMQRLEERMDADKIRLQKELEELKQNNDYLNVRYSEIKDSLNIISKNIDNVFERIKEYAQNMVLENLDEREDNYIKAYECFSRGELDSVSYYLPENELNLKHEKVLQLQEEAKKKKELAAILTEAAKAEEEYSENSLSSLIKEWLLLARTYDMRNNYDKTMLYYEKAIQADSLNTDYLIEYANYLYSIREFHKAENYYLQCLKIYRELAEENPQAHLSALANILNSLAVSHKNNHQYSQALVEYEESLEIFRKLIKEDPKERCIADLAMVLNNFGNLYLATKEYSKALEKLAEALEIRRKLAENNTNDYLFDLSLTLNNLAIGYRNIKEYQKALEKYEEAVAISRNLAEDNPQKYLPYVAIFSANLAIVYHNVKEYTKAEEEYNGALKIFKELAKENPKVYSMYVVMILDNLSRNYLLIKEYTQSEQLAREALELNNDISYKIPLAHALLFQRRFSEAEAIYNELIEDDETLIQSLLNDLEELEEMGVIPEECNSNVEKIRRMLRQ